MTEDNEPFVLWAANVRTRDLLERAESLDVGGYTSMTVFTSDLVEWEQAGRSLSELRSECAARGARICTIDPYLAWYPDYDTSAVAGEAAALLLATEDDVFRYADELGSSYISLVAPFWGLDASHGAIVDALGALADRAASHGLLLQLETAPTSKVPDLAVALDLVEAVDHDSLGLLVDTYNVHRAGTTPADVGTLPHARVFQIQVADSTLEQRGTDYFDDALHYRELPGEGELPIVEMLAALAALGPLATCGPEVFSDTLNAMPAAEAARLTAAATRTVISAAGG